MPITLLFTFSQMPLIMRHSLDEKSRRNSRRGNAMDFITTHEELRTIYKTPRADRRLDPQGTEAARRPLPLLHRAKAPSC